MTCFFNVISGKSQWNHRSLDSTENGLTKQAFKLCPHPKSQKGLHLSSFSCPPKLSLVFSSGTVSFLQIFLSPQKSHYKNPKNSWINTAVTIGLTIHSKPMCDYFLAITIVFFFIQNSDGFVQNQMFLFKLKNYKDRKSRLGVSDYHFLLLLKFSSLQ